MKFKVGDKVRVLEESSILFREECVVIEVCDDGIKYPYIVRPIKESRGRVVYEEEDLELIEEAKSIKSNRLEDLTTALNILGSLGIELDVKIYAEINGKKISL